jgi:hypothetical protein
MPKFHARESEDGASVTYWNMESISHAEYVERTKTLLITLVDGFNLTLRGQDAADVMGYIRMNRFWSPPDPTPEQLALFGEHAHFLLRGESS